MELQIKFKKYLSRIDYLQVLMKRQCSMNE